MAASPMVPISPDEVASIIGPVEKESKGLAQAADQLEELFLKKGWAYVMDINPRQVANVWRRTGADQRERERECVCVCACAHTFRHSSRSGNPALASSNVGGQRKSQCT